MCPINKHHRLWLDIRIRGSVQFSHQWQCYKILPRINHMDQQESAVLLWSFSQGTELLPRVRHNMVAAV